MKMLFAAAYESAIGTTAGPAPARHSLVRAFPVAGHVLLVAAALMLLVPRDGHGLEVLAIAVVSLLLAGIRNAWDITAWAVTRSGRS